MSERFPDLPPHMARLPVDHRGFPVPWFVAWNDKGEPVFPAADAEKMKRAMTAGLCWVCGGTLGRYRASVIGPMCAVNRTISEPQSHVECAQFSARHCPFLANPRMGRVPETKVAAKADGPLKDAAGDGIKRNPGACAVWIETKPTKPFRVRNGVLFQLGDPERVEWYANGREATREEVMESITSGLPLLEATIEQEAPNRRASARAELERRTVAAMELLP